MCMIVNVPKANLEGVKALHNYLYDLTEPNYEVLELYKQIDDEVDELENAFAEEAEEVTAQEHLDDMRTEIECLIATIRQDKPTRDDIVEELKRILF